jgi:hypothetical protein
MRRLNGLSANPIPLDPGTPATAPTTVPTGTPSTPTKPSLTDQISKWLGIGQDIYNTYRNTVGAGTNPGTMNYTPPPPPPADNTKKYLVIGGVVAGGALLTYGVVQLFKK